MDSFKDNKKYKYIGTEYLVDDDGYVFPVDNYIDTSLGARLERMIGISIPIMFGIGLGMIVVDGIVTKIKEGR